MKKFMPNAIGRQPKLDSSTNFNLAVAVAVGTVIADRPPHRSVHARLRIRLLRRMGGVEASIGVGMQDAGWWYPPSQEWSNALPSHLCALAAADQNIPPQSVDTTFEDAQLINGFPPLYGWFTGPTAQSGFSSTCMSAVRFMAFADRP